MHLDLKCQMSWKVIFLSVPPNFFLAIVSTSVAMFSCVVPFTSM